MNWKFKEFFSSDSIDISKFESLNYPELIKDPNLQQVYFDIQTLTKKLFQLETEMEYFKSTLRK